MDCACSVSNDYDDDSVWNCGVREINKAGKDHTCFECGDRIEKGKGYFYHSVFGESTIQNFKVCNDCQSIIWQFFKEGWVFGSIWESLGDYLCYNWADDLPSSCISKLTPHARDKVCDIFEKIHTLSKPEGG